MKRKLLNHKSNKRDGEIFLRMNGEFTLKLLQLVTTKEAEE